MQSHALSAMCFSSVRWAWCKAPSPVLIAARRQGARQWKSPSWNSKYDEAKAALSVNVQALMQELMAQNC